MNQHSFSKSHYTFSRVDFFGEENMFFYVPL